MLTEYAIHYRRLWNQHWWWQSRRRFVLREVHRLLQHRPVHQILDIGCGDGLMFDSLAPFGEVWGIEPNAALIDPANPHRDRIRMCPFDQQYSDKNLYDLILMLDVLEHIENDQAALLQLHRLLKVGGYSILTVPALQMLWSEHDLVNQHFRRYTRRQLSDQLQKANLKIERIGYYFGWTVGPLLIRRLMRPSITMPTTSNNPYRISIPTPLINAALCRLTEFEHLIATYRGLPIGSSVFAVVRRLDDVAPNSMQG